MSTVTELAGKVCRKLAVAGPSLLVAGLIAVGCAIEFIASGFPGRQEAAESGMRDDRYRFCATLAEKR